MTFLDALQEIMRQPSVNKMAYAQTYADAILRGICPNDREHITCQILYIQGNLVNWRGATAREVKAALKSEYERLTA